VGKIIFHHFCKNKLSPLFYITTKMTHVTATVPKMRFVGSKVSFHIVQNYVTNCNQQSLSRCITCHRCPQQSHAAKRLPPQLEVNLCCHVTVPQWRPILELFAAKFRNLPASAGNVADMSELQAQNCMTPQQWTRLLRSVNVISENKTVITRIKSIKLLISGFLEIFGS